MLLSCALATAQTAEDSGELEANPGRPTVSSPAHIPPVGYLQFEQGFLQANGSPELAGQFGIVQVTKLSVRPRLMLQFATQPYANSTSDSGHVHDAGDLQLGAQVVLRKEAGMVPAVALAYLRRVRSGTAPDLDIGGFRQSGLLLVSGDVLRFHYDSNLVISEQTSGAASRTQYGQALSLTHNVHWPKLEMSGELWHFTQPFVGSGGNAIGLLCAAGFEVHHNFVLDAGIDHGLTTTSTRWEGFAGFTYLVPQRLWPERVRKPKPAHTDHHHHSR